MKAKRNGMNRTMPQYKTRPANGQCIFLNKSPTDTIIRIMLDANPTYFRNLLWLYFFRNNLDDNNDIHARPVKPNVNHIPVIGQRWLLKKIASIIINRKTKFQLLSLPVSETSTIILINKTIRRTPPSIVFKNANVKLRGIRNSAITNNTLLSFPCFPVIKSEKGFTISGLLTQIKLNHFKIINNNSLPTDTYY